MVRRMSSLMENAPNARCRNDNDMFHHLNNPIYGVLIDSIINSYLMQYAGYSTANWTQIGLVGNSYCDFFGAAQYPGMLDVGLRVVKMGKTSIMYEVGVFQEGSDQVKAVGGYEKVNRIGFGKQVLTCRLF
jgi:acyl-CoA thioester hydrolase